MAYFLQTKIPLKHSVKRGLQHIYGVGKTTTKVLCSNIGLQKDSSIQCLRRFHLSQIQKKLENFNRPLSNNLRRWEKDQIQHLIQIGSYRGRRHHFHLPLRGQRTHTNAKTQKRWKKK